MKEISYTSYKKNSELYIEIYNLIAVNSCQIELARKKDNITIRYSCDTLQCRFTQGRPRQTYEIYSISRYLFYW